MAQRNDRGRETPPDPLKGEMVPKGYAPGVGPVASGATTKSKTGVPPLPAATSSPSPAEIVQRGPPDPLYGEQPSLAIGKTTGPTQPVASWQPNGPSGVLASSAAGMSYDQLQDALAKFNPRSQRQETVPGGFKFTCEIPNPQRPEFSRHYEATARDYRSALLAVVEQVGRDRQGR